MQGLFAAGRWRAQCLFLRLNLSVLSLGQIWEKKGVIAIDSLALVDRLEALVSGGWRVPFTTRTAVDENGFFDIIDQMRVSIPQEVKQASQLLQQRDELLSAATEEAERIVQDAKEQAARLLDEHEIAAAARAEAASIKQQAQSEAEEIRRGADDYALGILSDLEGRLSSLLRTTSNGLAALKRRQSQAVSEERGKTP